MLNKTLEAVMSLFHGWICGAHFFAAEFFRRHHRRRWATFHFVVGLISLICSLVHKRDSR